MPIEFKIDAAAFLAIESNLRQTAKEILSNPALKQEVGTFAVERVKYQARAGKPFNATDKFPELKDSTVKNRKYLGKYNTTHDVFDPEFSNLTITGELLDSLASLDEGDTLLRIAFTGMHKPYVGAKGQRISKPIMNETLGKYLSEKGFNVFDKTLADKQQFVNRIKNICLGYIRRGLRVRNKLAQG
jgi:hypothetical protein